MTQKSELVQLLAIVTDDGAHKGSSWSAFF